VGGGLENIWWRSAEFVRGPFLKKNSFVFVWLFEGLNTFLKIKIK